MVRKRWNKWVAIGILPIIMLSLSTFILVGQAPTSYPHQNRYLLPPKAIDKHASLQVSRAITFTPVATIFLPSIQKSPTTQSPPAPAPEIYEIYVSPTGSKNNSGLTISDPVDSLLTACRLVDFRRDISHVIYVRGGTYVGHSFTWSNSGRNGPEKCANENSTSPKHDLTITAYKNEKPVFEGQGLRWLIDFRLNKGECTNITIRGLTIRHYINQALGFVGDSRDRSAWNGCNTISNNTFEEIGNLYDMGNCDGCKGFAAIALQNSDRNIIHDNVFVNIENTPDVAAYLHAIYFAHNSNDNHVYNNYVSMTSGDPMRVRDASNNNQIYDNYVDRSGTYGFISGFKGEGESLSNGNVIRDNTITFPYPLFDSIELICKTHPCDESTFIDGGQKLFDGSRPTAEDVGAIAAGDFDGDGKSELVVAFNYGNFVKVVRTTGGDDRHLQKVLYTSPFYTIHGFATGDFDGSSKDQLLTFLRLRSTGRTEIYRGDGLTSILNHGRIYESTIWDVTAMTAGDFDGDGVSESIIAFNKHAGGETRLYRGDGTSSILNLGQFYSSIIWDITALTSGDFNNDGWDELLSAFHRSSETRIYRGNGISSAINEGFIYSSTVWNIPALAAGYFNAEPTPQLVTAFKNRNHEETRLYQGNGLTSATNEPFYDSIVWRVSGLASGYFDDGPSELLATAFTWPTRTQIWAGDGGTSTTNKRVFHRWSAP